MARYCARELETLQHYRVDLRMPRGDLSMGIVDRQPVILHKEPL